MNRNSEDIIVTRIKEYLLNDPKMPQREAAERVGISHSKLNDILKRRFKVTYTDFRIAILNTDK